MHITISSDIEHLSQYIHRFIDLMGKDRWFKRANLLDTEMNSYYLGKTVADYHWLEMAISFQFDVLEKNERLISEFIDATILTALNFAAFTVEVHARLSSLGKQVLEGRLRDCLKSETGFAPLYLELDIAQRLMDDGCDVDFPDMEGSGQFDLIFSRGGSIGEVECKSISADAGRQIHRKDFYRFMNLLAPNLEQQMHLNRRKILTITLKARLSPNVQQQSGLLLAAKSVLIGKVSSSKEKDFEIDYLDLSAIFTKMELNETNSFYNALQKIFGPNIHIAGALTEESGCLVVMRSQREDDPSKPMLEAMRKASTQFSGKRPAFIAVQEHGMDCTELLSPPVYRRASILSNALFGHYGAAHVNGTYVTGFGAVQLENGCVGTPGFLVLNPTPKFQSISEGKELFFSHRLRSAKSDMCTEITETAP